MPDGTVIAWGLIDKGIRQWYTNAKLNKGYRLWKLGANPTQGRCCILPDSSANATGRNSGKALEIVPETGTGNESEYLPVICLPRHFLDGVCGPADYRGKWHESKGIFSQTGRFPRNFMEKTSAD